MKISGSNDGEIRVLSWDKGGSSLQSRPATEQELNVGKPAHTTMPTQGNEEDETFLTDVGRVAFSTLEAPVSLVSDFVVRPFAEDKEEYDDAYAEGRAKAAEYVPFLDQEDIIDPETQEILKPGTGAGTVLDIGTFLVGGGVVFKTLNKLSKSQRLRSLGKKIGMKKEPGLVAKSLIAEQATEQLLGDPNTNLANFVAEDIMDEPPAVIEYLAADKDDDVLLNRAKMAVTSGILTGGIAGLLELGFKRINIRKASKKVLGKGAPDTPEETARVAEELLGEARQGATTPVVETIREVTQDDAEGVAQIINQSAGGFKGGLKWLEQRWLKSRGFFSKKAFDASEEAVHTQRQLVTGAAQIARRLQRFMDDVAERGDKGITTRVSDALLDNTMLDMTPSEKIKYLTDSKGQYRFSKEIAQEVRDARGEIDRLSKTVLDSHIGSATVRESIEANMGEYMRRSYRLFEDANYVPTDDLIENAQNAIVDAKLQKFITEEFDSVEAIREANPSLVSDLYDQAKTQVSEILDRGDVANYNDYISKVRRINKKYLSEREDILPEIRKLMGEIESPTENIILTVQKLASITENNRFYTKLQELGGSVASDKEAFDRAFKQATLELKDVDATDIKNIGGRFVTMVDSGAVGKVIKRDGDNYIIEIKDFKTQKLTRKTVDDTKFSVIPQDQTLSKLTKKIYDAETGGNAYTKAQYIKENKDGVFSSKISGTGSALDGQYTTPELARAINNLEDTHLFWGVASKGFKNFEPVRWFSGAKGLNQQMRTVYDHTTHLRNALGGFQFGLANGLNPLSNGRLNFQVLKNEIGGEGDKVFDSLYTRLQGLGVINTSVRASEARALLDIAKETSPARFISRLDKYAEKYNIPDRGVELARLIKERPEQIYMATDDFFKMNAFANELATLRKAHKGDASWTPERLEKAAAEIVKDTMPNYDRVFKGVKALREMPVGNFVSFPAEIMRTSVNIIKRGIDEGVEGITTGNATLFRRGAQRLAGFGTLNAGWFAIGHAGHNLMSNKLLGFTDLQNQGAQVNAEGFTVNHNKQFLRGEDGEMYVHDPTYLNSYNIWQDIALGFHRELSLGELNGERATERLSSAMMSAVGSVIQPFTDEAMFTSLMTDLNYAWQNEQGRTSSGRKIFEDKDSLGESVFDAMGYVALNFAPGFVLDSKKFAEAVFETPNESTGLKRSLSARTVEMLSGINFRKYRPEDNFKYHVKKYNRIVNYELDKVRPRFGKDSEDYFEIYTQAQAKKYEASQELYRQVEAMRNLGFKAFDIWKLMEDAGMRGRTIRRGIMRGKFTPDKISVPVKNQILRQAEDKDSMKADMYKIRQYTDFMSYLNLQPVEKEDIRSSRIIRDKMSLKDFERLKFKKGGEVYNVANVGTEPDERIDKMTGLPYNIQAGSAFMDEEDPLKRLGFTGGGQVDPLVRLGFFRGGKILGSLQRSRFMKGGPTYKIQKGDTLSEIAKTQGVSQEELQELNQIENPDKIFAGAELKLPEREEAVVEQEISEEFTEKDTANIAADTLREVVLSEDRDLEAEIEAEKKSGISFNIIREARGDTLDEEVTDSPKEEDADDGIFSGGIRRLHQVLNDNKKELDAGQITEVEAGVRAFAARIDVLFSPIGELVGTVASALTPDAIEESIKRELAEIGGDISAFIKENGLERSAKNIAALSSIIGIVPTAQIIKRGLNTVAAGTKTKLDKFYNKGFDKDGNAIPFDSPLERKAYQTTSAGIAFSQAGPEGIVDALLPGMIARRRAGAAGSKRKEIIQEAETANIEDAYASSIAGRNIVDQSPDTELGDLLKDSAIEKSYIHTNKKLSDEEGLRAALFKDYNDFDTPIEIQNRAMNHILFGPWTEGISVNVRGRKIGSERPLNPNNTDVDVKRLDGPQQLLGESHGTSDVAANSLRKIFKVDNRVKMAKYINQLNPDGTPKAGVRLTGGNPQKVSLGTKRNTDVDVEGTLAGATPEQIKAWLNFDAGGKQGSSVKFKVDEKNPNIVYWSDSHASKSKESGGVNDFIAMDLKTGDVYTMISDKHDMLANLNPVGGSSRLTISPLTKRNFKDPKKVGTHKQRNYQEEAQATLDMLEEYKLELPEGGLAMPSYDPVTGLIPTGTKTVKLLKETKADMDTLRKIANAEKIEKVGNSWKIDGKTISKGELEAATNINLTAIAHFSGKASAKDYGVLARRLGKAYLATDFLTGESAKKPSKMKKVPGETTALYESVPKPATREEMFNALKESRKEGQLGQRDRINLDIPEGTKVGLRLDIPAYTEHNVWVPTLKPLEGPDKTSSHRATAAITNPDLSVSEALQSKALKVKEGGPKSPFAVIKGSLVNRTDEQNYLLAQQHLKDPEWTQVGYNPKKHSYFFDRETGQPVIGGEEAIQVGPLVLVKKAKFGKREDYKYAMGGKVLTASRRLANAI